MARSVFSCFTIYQYQKEGSANLTLLDVGFQQDVYHQAQAGQEAEAKSPYA